MTARSIAEIGDLVAGQQVRITHVWTGIVDKAYGRGFGDCVNLTPAQGDPRAIVVDLDVEDQYPGAVTQTIEILADPVRDDGWYLVAAGQSHWCLYSKGGIWCWHPGAPGSEHTIFLPSEIDAVERIVQP